MDKLKALERLEESLSKLPSIGKKSAERLAFAMLEMEDDDLIKTIQYAHNLNKKVYVTLNIFAWDEKYPEIVEMQAKAIFEAKNEVEEKGIRTHLEIMVPLVGTKQEFNYIKDVIKKVYEETSTKKEHDYMIGTMIEVPRGAIIADSLAQEAEFFSFGTNDLTQMTYGFSRDDAGKFLETYYEKGILDFNPFEKLDTEGVGSLIKEAVLKAKRANKNIEFGICGEQGADEESIKFLAKIGIDYISCSPYRIPAAKLACAKATIDK